MENKTTCILFKTVFDAALRFTENNQPDIALDILLSYGKYAFGYTEGVEANSLTAEVIVKQNLPSLDAATNRYNAAVENGKKGKEYGILGKEYGKKGGRPRKGETKEEAKERKENETKTPQKTPLTVAVSDSISISEDLSNSIDNTISKETEVIDIPIKEKETYKEKEKTLDKTRPGQQQITSDRYILDSEILGKMSNEERNLQIQYNYVLRDLPTIEEYKSVYTDVGWSQEALDWTEQQDTLTITNCMLDWNHGGREKFTELVQGLSPKITKEILEYAVLYCKALDTRDCCERLAPVYTR